MSGAGTIVYIVDDEAKMRKGIARLLRTEGFETQEFATANEFLAACDGDRTACLILDVSMPGLDGLELQRRMNQLGMLVPIVFLTGRGDIPMSVRAIKTGAVDFLTKPVDADDLLRAVNAALELAVARKEARMVASALSARYSRLTPREREVMSHVVSGKLNKQIAADLGTGEQNIKIHRGRVMAKMEVESLADLVRAAERLDLRSHSTVSSPKSHLLGARVRSAG